MDSYVVKTLCGIIKGVARSQQVNRIGNERMGLDITLNKYFYYFQYENYSIHLHRLRSKIILYPL